MQRAEPGCSWLLLEFVVVLALPQQLPAPCAPLIPGTLRTQIPSLLKELGWMQAGDGTAGGAAREGTWREQHLCSCELPPGWVVGAHTVSDFFPLPLEAGGCSAALFYFFFLYQFAFLFHFLSPSRPL